MGRDGMFGVINMDSEENDKKFLDLHRAKYLTEIDRAEDGLELVREVEDKIKTIKKLSEGRVELKGELANTQGILAQYIEKFGDFKKDKNEGYSMDFGLIQLPHPEQFKVFDKIVGKGYEDTLYIGDSVTVKVTKTEEGYVVEDRKIKKSKTRI